MTLGLEGYECIITIDNGNYQKEQLINAINKQIYDKTNPNDSKKDFLFRGYYDVSKNYTSNIDLASSSYLPFPIIELKYYSHNDKAYIYNYDPDGRELNITWYDNDIGDVCAARLKQNYLDREVK